MQNNVSQNSLLHLNDKDGAFPPSYYAATAKNAVERPRLRGITDAEICIIGGGFTGLSAALHCAQRGRSVVVLDAHRAGWGASGRNGGQVGVGQRIDQNSLEALVGADHAREAFRIGVEAPALVRSLIDENAISADYKPGLLHTNHRAHYDAEARDYATKLQDDYGYDRIRFVEREEMPEMLGAADAFGGTLDTGGGHIHPLNFALGLANAAEAAGARLYDRAEVASVTPGELHEVRVRGSGTREGEIVVRAKIVLYACNGYLGGLERRTSARVMPINAFVVATEPLSEELCRSLIRDDVAVADSRFVVNYYRLSADRRMLFGGGETYGYRFPRDIRAFVRRPMLSVFPQLADVALDYGWGGTLGITMKRLPDYAELGPNLYSLSGYSGSGVAMATKSGQIFADLLDGDDRDFRIMQGLPTLPFPGAGRWRQPLLIAAMSWYALRDRF